MTATETGFLAAIFRGARTFSYWQARPVPEALVESAFELACLGPTSANCQPLRLLLVRSPVAKERLLPCVSSGNFEKVRTAPITAIVAYDLEFFELLPRLYPHTDARVWFTSNPALVEETGLRNSSLQGAYFMVALRAQAETRLTPVVIMSGLPPGNAGLSLAEVSAWLIKPVEPGELRKRLAGNLREAR